MQLRATKYRKPRNRFKLSLHVFTQDHLTPVHKNTTRTHLGVEDDGGSEPGSVAGERDAVAQLHPRHRQDGARVRARQRERVVLLVREQPQRDCDESQHTTSASHHSHLIGT